MIVPISCISKMNVDSKSLRYLLPKLTHAALCTLPPYREQRMIANPRLSYPAFRYQCCTRVSVTQIPEPLCLSPFLLELLDRAMCFSIFLNPTLCHGGLLCRCIHYRLRIHLRHRRCRAGQIGGRSLRILGIVIRNRRSDGVPMKRPR